jgi:hypothetical protein
MIRTLASLLILVLLVPVSAGSLVQEKGAVLTGAVLDWQRAVVLLPPQTVIVEELNTKQVQKVSPDDSGNYRLTLPAGTYSITTEGRGVFLPFRRAAFQLQEGTTSSLNLVLSLRWSAHVLSVPSKGSGMEAAPAPRYDEYSIPDARSDRLKLLIEHFGKRTERNRIVYEYATMSFDLLTIHADAITLDRKSKRLEMSGEAVIVEDGNVRRTVSRAEVSFKDGKAIVSHPENSNRTQVSSKSSRLTPTGRLTSHISIFSPKHNGARVVPLQVTVGIGALKNCSRRRRKS